MKTVMFRSLYLFGSFKAHLCANAAKDQNNKGNYFVDDHSGAHVGEVANAWLVLVHAAAQATRFVVHARPAEQRHSAPKQAAISHVTNHARAFLGFCFWVSVGWQVLFVIGVHYQHDGHVHLNEAQKESPKAVVFASSVAPQPSLMRKNKNYLIYL